ncbi:MAG: helix-turn-helix transcriptional regulator [Ruminococcus flavefaciens]|nr:helix-turn-helix transcriptional regulator [Ruminococcus flavefaciens]
MYTAQETALKIKEIAKQKGITIKKMLNDCDLNINYISEMAKGKQPAMKNLEKIAVYLNSTTDELLGVTSVEVENQAISMTSQDEMLYELVRRFQRLSFDDKLDVFNYINAK